MISSNAHSKNSEPTKRHRMSPCPMFGQTKVRGWRACLSSGVPWTLTPSEPSFAMGSILKYPQIFMRHFSAWAKHFTVVTCGRMRSASIKQMPAKRLNRFAGWTKFTVELKPSSFGSEGGIQYVMHKLPGQHLGPSSQLLLRNILSNTWERSTTRYQISWSTASASYTCGGSSALPLTYFFTDGLSGEITINEHDGVGLTQAVIPERGPSKNSYSQRSSLSTTTARRYRPTTWKMPRHGFNR